MKLSSRYVLGRIVFLALPQQAVGPEKAGEHPDDQGWMSGEWRAGRAVCYADVASAGRWPCSLCCL